MALFRRREQREEAGSKAEVNVRLNSLEERTNQIKARIKRLEQDVEMYRKARELEKRGS